MTRILGISAFYHDAAAALVVDGAIVAAAQEERFTRRKHDPSFPANAARFCLAFAPRGFTSFRQALPLWLKEKLFQKSMLVKDLHEALGNGNGVDWQQKLL